MSKLQLVIKQFGLTPEDYTIQEVGNGLINNTYLLKSDSSYILQEINGDVFPEPIRVMENIGKLFQAMGVSLSTYPKIIHAVSGDNYYQDSEASSWRVFSLVENAKSFAFCSSLKQAKQAGEAAGKFQAFLLGLDPNDYHIVIKDFLNIQPRQLALKEAVAADSLDRVGQVKLELDIITQFDFTQFDFNSLPIRLAHNDLKLNNILFDQDSGEGLAVIDYDTVMPGLVLYDFGDLIRTAASKLPEDSKEIKAVDLDLDIYQALTKSYLAEVSSSLAQEELETLHLGPLYMSLMLGIRFLTDYLAGDKYFHIDYAEHNLVRAKNQLALAARIQECLSSMSADIKRLK